MHKLKSTDAYREIRTVVGPWCKANGFKRGKSGLSYAKPIGEKHLLFWFQVTRNGWDDYSGSAFIVEFQLSSSPNVGAIQGIRRRLPHFLAEIDLARVRQMENSVVASLPRPPRDHPVLTQMGRDVAEWFLQKFKPRSQSYTTSSDIWFRYHSAEHVRKWAEFVLSVLPRATSEMAAQA
jgi:hypothetical protein